MITTPICTEFSQRLYAVIEYQNWTQTSLAKAMGISTAAINRYLNAGTYPSYDVLKKLVQITGISADWYLGVNPFSS